MPEENPLMPPSSFSPRSRSKRFSLAVGWTIILVALGGCTMGPKMFPLSDRGVTVLRDTIYENGTPFAEVRYFKGSRPELCIRGLGIYYYTHNKEKWISPDKGWTLELDGVEYRAIDDIDREFNRILTEKEYREWVEGRRPRPETVPVLKVGGRHPEKLELGTCIRDVKISADGKHVYYTSPGFFKSQYDYLVEYGVSK